MQGGCFELILLGKSVDKGIRSRKARLGKMELGLQGSMEQGRYNVNHLKRMVMEWF